jgi:hypothetical protein
VRSKGGCTYDHQPGTEEAAQRVVDQAWIDIELVKNSWAPQAKREAAYSRLKKVMSPDDHRELGRALLLRHRRSVGAQMLQAHVGALMLRAHVTHKETRTGRHTIQQHVIAFSAGGKLASASSSGDDGPLPPRAADRAAHQRLAHPPSARRGHLLPAGDYLSTALASTADVWGRS